MNAVTLRQCAILTDGLDLPLGPLLRDCLRFGVEDVLLLSSQPPDALAAATVDLALPWRPRITVCAAPAADGSAGALRHVRDRLQEKFLLAGGPLAGCNLAELLADAAADGPDVFCRMAMRETAAGKVNAELYVMDRALVDRLGVPCALARDVLPRLAESGRLRATILAPAPPRPGRALFLARDGVINREAGYVGTRKNFAWMPGAREAIRQATAWGWQIFVVTNQPGIARGFYTAAEMEALHLWMIEEIRRARGNIDDLAICPAHPDGAVPAYRRDTGRRMPAPGMILDLLGRWALDPADCLFIGAQAAELAAAKQAGVKAHLFESGDLAAFLTACVKIPELAA